MPNPKTISPILEEEYITLQCNFGRFGNPSWEFQHDDPSTCGNESLTAVTLCLSRVCQKGRGLNVWDDLQDGVLLGTERFVEQAFTKEVPRKERLAARPSLAELFSGA